MSCECVDGNGPTATKVSGITVTNVFGPHHAVQRVSSPNKWPRRRKRFNRSRAGAGTLGSGSTALKRRAPVDRSGSTALKRRLPATRAVQPHPPNRQSRYRAVNPPFSGAQRSRTSGSTAPNGPRHKGDERIEAQSATRSRQLADQPLGLGRSRLAHSRAATARGRASSVPKLAADMLCTDTTACASGTTCLAAELEIAILIATL
jgi:hypothetical protein